ncbi:hypothetical protein M0804_012434 [Polistes exclamans]|nr:hypothetical protein M0804_012434 [Polistes exclamans]
MYSLYRAWFGDDNVADNYNRLQETLSPPDTVIRVGNEGEHQFIAHKGILAAHSGYLKALLASAAANNSNNGPPNFAGLNSASSSSSAATATGLGGQHARQQQPVTSVSVSSIGGEAFAPLLNYMYTGRLEVTLDNVYSVLLATHLLHMPGALEQCRAALLRLRAPPPLPTPIPIPPVSTSTSTSNSGPGSILRPIPNRLVLGPPLCWPQTSSIYPSTATGPTSVGLPPHLPQMQPTTVLIPPSVSPNLSVIPSLSTQETQEPSSSTHYRLAAIIFLRLSTIDVVVHFKQESSSRIIDTISTTTTATTTTTISSSNSTTTTTGETTTITTSINQRRRSNENSNSIGNSPSRIINNTDNTSKSLTITDMDPRERRPSHRRKNRIPNNNHNNNNNNNQNNNNTNTNNSNDPSSSNSNNLLSVVYDVACCDGPVKFHRVLNENYTLSQQARLQRHCIEETIRPTLENDENGGSRTSILTTTTTTTPTTRIRNCPIDPMVNSQTNDSTNTNTTNTTTGNNVVGNYSCGYCRHTFKSQYCYRKHAKRHLLPTRSSSNNETTTPTTTTTTITTGNERNRQDSGTRNRREVRLLDLNVQYYPCKICGCKFPSYYFVHKHRKLCHANVEDNHHPRVNNRDDVVNYNDQESITQPTVVDDTPTPPINHE